MSQTIAIVSKFHAAKNELEAHVRTLLEGDSDPDRPDSRWSLHSAWIDDDGVAFAILLPPSQRHYTGAFDCDAALPVGVLSSMESALSASYLSVIAHPVKVGCVAVRVQWSARPDW